MFSTKGVQKQSVEDVERLFSSSLIAWMEKKSYIPEAEYLSIIHNSRRACDGRGITDSERSQFNKEFLDYIIDYLMPYHRGEGFNDLSLLEINRYIMHVMFAKLCLTHKQKCHWIQRVQSRNNSGFICQH